MPQFDTFIFGNSLLYIVSFFFILLSVNFTRILPVFGSLLKLRHKTSVISSSTNVSKISYDKVFPGFVVLFTKEQAK